MLTGATGATGVLGEFSNFLLMHARGTQHQNVVQDSTLKQDNRSGANRGRGQRQRPHSLHERIRF